ncbi:hypothetical protein E3J74_04480 [Candidatus Bathyarchaeota archaeon]|nr:MAG: hypothetical protein E3J74_04480 [Candidatus Bathyarchaeota archaeon]
MTLPTEKERRILELAAKDLSDYKIARHLGSDPPTVNRSRKNALRKLREAEQDLAWAKELGYPNIREHARNKLQRG